MKYFLNAEPKPKIARDQRTKAPCQRKKPSFLARHKYGLALLLLLLLIPALVWALLPNFRLKKAMEVQAHLLQLEAADTSKEERKEVDSELDRLKRDLTPSEKRILRQEENRLETVQMKKFAAMSQEERNHILDVKLQKEEEKRRREDEKKNEKNDKPEKKAVKEENGGGQFGGQAAAMAGGFNGGKPGDPGAVADLKVKPQQTPEYRDNRMREHLADSSPETRGLKYLMQVETQRRRIELGLPPGGKGGGS